MAEWMNVWFIDTDRLYKKDMDCPILAIVNVFLFSESE